MKWEPNDVLRMVALIGAFIFFGVGTVMMINGITAEGAIDVKSSIISGSLRTGSAGLFIVFLSFIVVAFVVGSVFVSSIARNHDAVGSRRSAGQRAVRVIFGLLGGAFASGAIAALTDGTAQQVFVGLTVVQGFMAFFWLVLSLPLILSED